MITRNYDKMAESAKLLLEQAKEERDYSRKYDLLLSYKTLISFLDFKSEDKEQFSKLLDIYETYGNNESIYRALIGFYYKCSEKQVFDANYDLTSRFEKEISLKDDCVSSRELLEKVRDFYGSLDSEMYMLFKKFIKDKNNTILLTKDGIKSNNENYSFSGLTVASNLVPFKYMFINNQHDFYTYVSLVHEFGHAIASYKDDNRYNEFNPFGEAEALFPELIAIYEAMSDDSFIADYYAIRFLENNLDDLNAVYEHFLLISAWQKNEFRIDKEYFDILKRLGIKKKLYDSLCKFDFFESVPYLNGMRLVLRLFNIYKEDKVAAIELYKKIAYGNEKDRNNAIMAIKGINPVDEVCFIQDKVYSHINKKHS